MFSMCTKVKSRSADPDSSFMQQSQQMQMQLQQPQAMGKWGKQEAWENRGESETEPRLRLSLRPKMRPERQ